MNHIEQKTSHLVGVEESMLITLAARAQESKEKKPLFKDSMAEEIYSKVRPYIKGDFDYRAMIGTIVRCATFDECIPSLY
ncbi:MAG: hypothetical protein Q4Q07_02440 [Tissierellia bacterium]|nr:hypothetical protein [Tissierellia bacterium]